MRAPCTHARGVCVWRTTNEALVLALIGLVALAGSAATADLSRARRRFPTIRRPRSTFPIAGPASMSASTAAAHSAIRAGTRPATATSPAASSAAPSATIINGAARCSASKLTSIGPTSTARPIMVARSAVRRATLDCRRSAAASAMPPIASCPLSPPVRRSAISGPRHGLCRGKLHQCRLDAWRRA